VIEPNEDCNRGHFPEHAIVPGAYLISQIEFLLKQTKPSLSIQSLKKVKFAAPLTPGNLATLTLSSNDGSKLKFTLSSNEKLILQGSGSLI